MSPSHTPENIAATFCATLVDEWIHHGVRHAVIAPGSRSTPMALAIAARREMSVHVFHDERAASFAALGIGQIGPPAILLCTSGTAAAHFHAAVIEAHQSAVAMLVCTADRPPELRDVGAPQTIDQTKLYGSAVRWFHEPGVASAAAAHTWRSLAAHAFGSATGLWPGPVHLNLAFREPLIGEAGELPARNAVSSVPVSLRATAAVDREQLQRLASAIGKSRGVIVAGRGCGDAGAIRELSRAAGWPVLADARSGVRHLADVAIAAGDRLLRNAAFADEHVPEVVLCIGEPPASKVLNQWLAASGALHVHVTAQPSWTDPDGVISHRVVADPGPVCSLLASMLTVGDPSWIEAWVDAEAGAQRAIDQVLAGDEMSEPLVARSVAGFLPRGAHLMVSSSMPIRDIEWYGLIPEGITVHSNRGANGIDGVIATAIGVAVASGAPTAVLIGDIAFLHDSSALIGLMARSVDLRIVVIDNDGGAIFSFLPQATTLSNERFEQLFGTPHGVDLVALTASHGIPALTVDDLESFAKALEQPGPAVIRIESDRRANVVVHRRLNGA